MFTKRYYILLVYVVSRETFVLSTNTCLKLTPKMVLLTGVKVSTPFLG